MVLEEDVGLSAAELPETDGLGGVSSGWLCRLATSCLIHSSWSGENPGPA